MNLHQPFYLLDPIFIFLFRHKSNFLYFHNPVINGGGVTEEFQQNVTHCFGAVI